MKKLTLALLLAYLLIGCSTPQAVIYKKITKYPSEFKQVMAEHPELLKGIIIVKVDTIRKDTTIYINNGVKGVDSLQLALFLQRLKSGDTLTTSKGGVTVKNYYQNGYLYTDISKLADSLKFRYNQINQKTFLDDSFKTAMEDSNKKLREDKEKAQDREQTWMYILFYVAVAVIFFVGWKLLRG
jgi:hypothetical protein